MMKLNLQLFADGDQGNVYNDSSIYFNGSTSPGANTQTIAAPYAGTSGTELANLTPEMKEFYSKYLIELVGPQLIHAQFGEDESMPANHGSTMEWRRWSKFTKALTPLEEGKTPAPSLIEATALRTSLYQYGDWSMLTDIVSLTAIDNVLVQYTTRHSENAALTLDTLVRNAMIAGCTNYVYAGGAKSIHELATTLNVNDIAKVVTYLKNNNAPKFDGSYVAIVHPSVSYDIMTSEGFIDVVKYQDSARIFNNEIGKLYGVRFVETTESKLTKAPVIGAGDEATSAITITGWSSGTATIPKKIIKAADELNGQHFYLHSIDDDKIEEITITDCALDTDNDTLDWTPGSITPAAGDIIYSTDAAMDGEDYFTCLFLGKGAYRKVKLENNGNYEIIVETGGGTFDPLHQRRTVGWKVNRFGAAVTIPDYMFKLYVTSGIKGVAAND